MRELKITGIVFIICTLISLTLHLTLYDFELKGFIGLSLFFTCLTMASSILDKLTGL